jgi:DNA-binding transcriptional LysR family regulator
MGCRFQSESAADFIGMRTLSSVVSKTIADLEHVLGVRLLDRTSQGVEVTAYGRALLNCGTAVFDDLRQGMQEIAFLSDPTAGKLRVGGAGPFIDGLIPAAIARLGVRYRRIEFHVTESDPPTLCRMVRERQIDLAILRTSGSIYSEDLQSDALFEEPLFIIAGLDNPRWRRRKIDLQDLLDEPWALRLRVKVLPVSLSMKAPPTEIITLKNRTPTAVARLFVPELHAVAEPLNKNRR